MISRTLVEAGRLSRGRGACALMAAAGFVFLAGVAGDRAFAQKPAAFSLRELRTLQPGISFAEVTLPRPDKKTARLWIYLPSPARAGKLPAIVIAPAGTPLTCGIRLQEGDRSEHLPYVRAGYAVIAYDIDGAPDRNDVASIRTALREFRAAEGGVANAKAAI